jgi:hypothetical protein
VSTPTRANVDYWQARWRERVGNPYVYGGVYSPSNIHQGCDCSALAAHVLNGVLFGAAMTWQRVDPTRGDAWITTESWRPIDIGQRGPFGTITVARPQDIPADAAVKVALHHGEGGGANSHMWLECDGVLMESAGSKGSCTAPQAKRIDDPYGNDWSYLPGPIGGVSVPLPPDIYADIWLELGSVGPQVVTLQTGLRDVFPSYAAGVPVHGTYEQLTQTAVREFQTRSALEPDGIVGPATAAELGKYGIDLTAPSEPVAPPVAELTERELLTQIWDQLCLPWPQLGNRTLVDAVADLLGR